MKKSKNGQSFFIEWYFKAPSLFLYFKMLLCLFTNCFQVIFLPIHTIYHTLHRKLISLLVCLCSKIIYFHFSISFFFNWKTPIGYVTAIAMQSIAIFLSVNIYVGLLFIYFGVCLFSVTFTTDIELNLNASNEKLKIDRSKNGKLEFKRKLNEIWQFHSDAKMFGLSTFGYIYIYQISFINNFEIFIFQFCPRLLGRFQ